MKLKIVKVIWDDAADDGRSWVKIGSFRGTVNVTSIGILIKKTKDTVIIARSMCEDGEACGVFYIPRGCVKSIEYLCEIKEEK